MADSSKSKDKSHVQTINWGSTTPTVEYYSNPTKTVWKKTSATTSFTVTVTHEPGANPAEQTFTGTSVTITLCDGVYTFQASG